MLALRKAQIEQAVQEELARLRLVEARLHQLEDQGQIHEPDVVLKPAPAQPFLALRETLAGIGAVRQVVRSIVTRAAPAVAPSSLGTLAVVIHSPIYEPDALDVEVGYLLLGRAPETVRLSEDRALSMRTLPAEETLATLVHIGRVEETHQTYGALATWIERHGYQIAGPARELLVQLPDAADIAVVELQLPVSLPERAETGA